MHRNLRKALLVSVSVFALSCSIAQAQEVQSDGRLWIELSGMAPFWKGGSDKYWYNAAELAAGFGPPPATVLLPGNGSLLDITRGYSFSGEIGYQFADSPWSVRFRVGHGISKKKSGSNAMAVTYVSPVPGSPVYTYGAVLNVDKKERLTYLDFEVGRDVGLGADGPALTLVGGLRVASFKSKETVAGTFAIYTPLAAVPIISGPITASVRRKFTGFGPRLGLEANVPMNEVLSLKMEAAGALLFGKRKVTAVDGIGNVFSRSKSAVIPNLEASVGLALKPDGSNIQLTLGYGVNAFFNMVDSGFQNQGSSKSRVLHGPKVDLRVDF